MPSNIVKSILKQRQKAAQVDMMLNPPDIQAGGPGSGRRAGGGKGPRLSKEDKEKMHFDKAEELENKAQEAFERGDDRAAAKFQKESDKNYRKSSSRKKNSK